MINRSRFSEEEGISLVEMLVAIMVLGLLFGALAQSLTTSLFSAQRQERQVHATALGAELAESAVSLPWASVGLCDGDAATVHAGTDFTYPSGVVEPLVLIDDADPICADAPLAAREVIERADNDYTVETVITWHDDVQDNTGPGGTDPNTTEDLKRIFVTVSWNVRGQPNTYSTETFLTPEGAEIGFRTRVDHAGGVGWTYVDPTTNLTETPVYLRLFTGTKQRDVKVEWEVIGDDGVTVETITRWMSDSASDGRNWVLLIDNGSPDLAINKLPNAQVLFTFTATDARDTSVVNEVTDRGLFLIRPDGYGIAQSSEELSETVDLVGSDPCRTEFELEVFVAGALSSDPATFRWVDETILTSLTPQEEGSSFAGTAYRLTVPLPVVTSPTTRDFVVRSDRPADEQSDEVTATVTWSAAEVC